MFISYVKVLLCTLCTLVLFMAIQSNDDMDFGGGDPYSDEGLMDASYGGMGGDPYGGDPYGGNPYGGDPYGGMRNMMGGDPYGGGDPSYGGSEPHVSPPRELFSVDEIKDFINVCYYIYIYIIFKIFFFNFYNFFH
jgi:hypothetical protein